LIGVLWVHKAKGGKEMELRDARERAGLTQEELSNTTGISVAMIQSMEVGRRLGSIKTVVKLAQVLGVTVDDLLNANHITKSTRKERAK
jgi:DNA-binding XRE family transcriptional regulator